MESAGLARRLGRCAGVCRQTLAAYLDPDDAEASEFGRSLIAAVAAMEAVADCKKRSPPEREAALELTSALSRAAADTCRRHGLDPALLRTAATCEEAAALCDRARPTSNT